MGGREWDRREQEGMGRKGMGGDRRVGGERGPKGKRERKGVKQVGECELSVLAEVQKLS